MERVVVPGLLVVLAAGVTVVDLVRGETVAAVVSAVVLLGLAWFLSPLRGSRGTSHAEVADLDLDHEVVVYWRPGCVYCERMRAVLGRRATSVRWVSIWADGDAAAYVRSVNDGNETVPTVLIRGEPVTNPSPARVRAALGR